MEMSGPGRRPGVRPRAAPRRASGSPRLFPEFLERTQVLLLQRVEMLAIARRRARVARLDRRVRLVRLDELERHDVSGLDLHLSDPVDMRVRLALARRNPADTQAHLRRGHLA